MQIIDSPFADRKPKPRVPHKHDALCITAKWGGRFCWCKCAQCWDQLNSRCICSACYCNRNAA